MPGLSAETLANLLREQSALIVKQLKELSERDQLFLKKLIAIQRAALSAAAGGRDPAAVVYVGDEIESMQSQTERNLESKLKLQTLLGVVLVYSSVALAIPLIYFLFKRD